MTRSLDDGGVRVAERPEVLMLEAIDLFVDAMWDRYGDHAHTIALSQAHGAHPDSKVEHRWYQIADKLSLKSQLRQGIDAL